MDAFGGKPTIFGNIHIPGKPSGKTHKEPFFVGTFLASPLWTVPRPVSAVPEDPHVVFQPQHRWVADQMCFGDGFCRKKSKNLPWEWYTYIGFQQKSTNK